MSNTEFDCEMQITGVSNLGDSQRKGYEGQIKCSAKTPQIYLVSQGDSVVGAMKGRLAIEEVQLYGVCQSPGNLRQAMVSDKTKFSSIIINRFAKIQGSKEETVIQTITLSQASIMAMNINDHDCTFNATFGYEKIEIKDFKVKAEDGTLDGSPIVTSYNRLTGEVNA